MTGRASAQNPALVAMVVPCFNEEHRWRAETWRALTSLPATSWTFVNDGSLDNTSAIIRDTLGPQSAVLDLPSNLGKANAVRLGLLEALEQFPGAIIAGFMDADGAFSITDTERLIGLARNLLYPSSQLDAVWSSRVALAGRDIDRTTRRHYIGRVVATLLSMGASSLPYDTQSGFKLYSVNADLKTSLREPFRTRWFFDLELHYRLLARGRGRVWEEPLMDWSEVPGSKMGWKQARRVAVDLAVVKRLQRCVDGRQSAQGETWT